MVILYTGIMCNTITACLRYDELKVTNSETAALVAIHFP